MDTMKPLAPAMNGRAHASRQRCAVLAALALLLAALWPTTSWAVYINRYSTSNRGAVIFTGNTFGLTKQNNVNAPGAAGSIGTFITTNLLS